MNVTAVPHASFWNGKRVFLTGHTGFKGTWLCHWLHELGAEVFGYALAPDSTPAVFDVLHTADIVHHHVGDVADQTQVLAQLQASQADIVIHMAAQPLVRKSYRDPVETYRTNVMGTVHVLDAVRQTPSVRSVVIVTSDKCYENQEWPWGYRENEPMGGYDPYSNSKGCAELVTSAYRRSFFSGQPHRVSVASARAGNVLGGGDWSEDRLIPDAVRAWTSGAAVQIRSPHATRPWQHVLEPLRGYLVLAEKAWHDTAYARAFNFGPADHDVLPVGAVMDRLCAAWGEGAAWQDISDREHGPHEAGLLKLDSSLAAHRMGWRPKIPLSQCLQWTAEWYRAHAEGASAEALRGMMLAQIRTAGADV
ncbi:MAG: CDP-glucose 4,6-dehydratase [Myxococcales bacterium]|nr:CDP-glucose 4,6-dehydratase [Myxococcales bacterium]